MSYWLTSLPTSLLCRFIRYRPLFTRAAERIFLSATLRALYSGASTNILDNDIPNLTSSLQPPHSQPRDGCFLFLRASHAHSLRFPCLQDLLAACTTPAEVIAYTNAASRLPVTGERDETGYITAVPFCKRLAILNPLTYIDNLTEHRRWIGGRAVPALFFKLFLTFGDSQVSPLSECRNEVWLILAHSHLLRGQARNSVTCCQVAIGSSTERRNAHPP